MNFTATHEWIEYSDDTTALIGLTKHAAEALGDIVFIDLPEVGDTVTAGECFADVESVKAASEIFSPVTGVITAVNDILDDAPETLNAAPEETWIIQVSEITETVETMDASAYDSLEK